MSLSAASCCTSSHSAFSAFVTSVSWPTAIATTNSLCAVSYWPPRWPNCFLAPPITATFTRRSPTSPYASVRNAASAQCSPSRFFHPIAGPRLRLWILHKPHALVPSSRSLHPFPTARHGSVLDREPPRICRPALLQVAGLALQHLRATTFSTSPGLSIRILQRLSSCSHHSMPITAHSVAL